MNQYVKCLLFVSKVKVNELQKFLFCEIAFSVSLCMKYKEIGSGFKCDYRLYKGGIMLLCESSRSISIYNTVNLPLDQIRQNILCIFHPLSKT